MGRIPLAQAPGVDGRFPGAPADRGRHGNREIVPIDSLSAQKRLVEAGFGIALLAESAVEEELRLGTLSVINVPTLKAAIPVSIVHRRNGYLGAAASALLATIAGGVRGGAVRRG